jgi:hypothetical protein
MVNAQVVEECAPPYEGQDEGSDDAEKDSEEDMDKGSMKIPDKPDQEGTRYSEFIPTSAEVPEDEIDDDAEISDEEEVAVYNDYLPNGARVPSPDTELELLDDSEFDLIDDENPTEADRLLDEQAEIKNGATVYDEERVANSSNDDIPVYIEENVSIDDEIPVYVEERVDQSSTDDEDIEIPIDVEEPESASLDYELDVKLTKKSFSQEDKECIADWFAQGGYGRDMAIIHSVFGDVSKELAAEIWEEDRMYTRYIRQAEHFSRQAEHLKQKIAQETAKNDEFFKDAKEDMADMGKELEELEQQIAAEKAKYDSRRLKRAA